MEKQDFVKFVKDAVEEGCTIFYNEQSGGPGKVNADNVDQFTQWINSDYDLVGYTDEIQNEQANRLVEGLIDAIDDDELTDCAHYVYLVNVTRGFNEENMDMVIQTW